MLHLMNTNNVYLRVHPCSIYRTIYTCALNNRGGVEIDLTVTPIDAGVQELHDPNFKGRTGLFILYIFNKKL